MRQLARRRGLMGSKQPRAHLRIESRIAFEPTFVAGSEPKIQNLTRIEREQRKPQKRFHTPHFLRSSTRLRNPRVPAEGVDPSCVSVLSAAHLSPSRTSNRH